MNTHRMLNITCISMSLLLSSCYTSREIIKEVSQMPPVQTTVTVPIYCIKQSQLPKRDCILDRTKQQPETVKKEVLLKHTLCSEQYTSMLFTILQNCSLKETP